MEQVHCDMSKCLWWKKASLPPGISVIVSQPSFKGNSFGYYLRNYHILQNVIPIGWAVQIHDRKIIWNVNDNEVKGLPYILHK